MRDIPLDVLLSFPKPNYENPEVRNSLAITVMIAVLTVLLTAVVGLRYYSRIALKRWFGLDDIFIGFAYITVVGFAVGMILAYRKFGWDRHIWDVKTSLYAPAFKMAMACKVLFVVGTTATRISLLCFYHRLLVGAKVRWFNWAFWISTVFMVVLGIVSVAFMIFVCNPVKAYWEYPPMPYGEYTCMHEGISAVWVGSFNTFADLLITVLPIPLIMRLQMPIRQRIGVVILLSLGFVVTAAGAFRTYYLWLGLVSSYDLTWLSYPLWISASVEMYLGVICACAPAVRPLFVKLFNAPLRTISGYFGAFVSGSDDRPSFLHTSKAKSNNWSKLSGSMDRSGTGFAGVANVEQGLAGLVGRSGGGCGGGAGNNSTIRGGNSVEIERCNGRSGGEKSNKLHITMEQTVELTTLSLTPEEQAQDMHDRIVPRGLLERGVAFDGEEGWA